MRLPRQHIHSAGAKRIASLQGKAARIWYNAMVPVPAPWGDNGQLMKYGVISHGALVDDLQNWSSFYISGRMQKPVAMIDGFGIHGRSVRAAEAAAAAAGTTAAAVSGSEGKGTTVIEAKESAGALEHSEQTETIRARMSTQEDVQLFKNASEENLQHALSAALILLPESFTEQALYEKIAGLSYAGDFRMSIAENPDKVKNIVRNGGSPARFRQLYRRAMRASLSGVQDFTTESNSDDIILPDSVELRQDVSAEARIDLLLSLPLAFRRRMAGQTNCDGHDEECLSEGIQQRLLGCSDDLQVSKMGAKIVAQGLHDIVSQTAMQQTLKGLISAGVQKSALYSFNKVRKRLRL